jgi:hypothetical protein
VAGVGAPLPALPVLLSRVLVQYAREWAAIDVGLERPPTLLQWSNLLRPVGGDGVRLSDAHVAARVSRRVLRSAFRDRRWFVVDPGDGGRGSQVVHLTEDGAAALDAGRARFEKVDAAWRERFGARSVDRVRSALEAFVAGLDLELPHFPMPYGPADWRVTGGAAVPAEPPAPAHGTDWPVVLRDGGRSTVAGLPLPALLSQAFVAFAIDYEAGGRGSMAARAMLGRIPPHGIAADRPLPSWLERDGYVAREPDPDRPRKQLLRLTAKGAKAAASCDRWMADVEDEWRRIHGDAAVDRLRAALGALAGELDPALPELLLVVFVGGLGFVAAL